MTRSLACPALTIVASTYTNMIIDVLAEDNATPVERVKVHIESVDFTTSAIINDDCHTGSALGSPCAVRSHTIEPYRVCSDIDSRSEIDLGTIEAV